MAVIIMASYQNVGYIRVSSLGQNIERQLLDVQLDKTFSDKLSGQNADRPQLIACIDNLREGDVLHVHSIDRLARNLLDLQNIVKQLNAKGVSIIFHKEQLEFNANKDADNMKASMQTLTLQLLGAFAQFERSLIKNRQAEGIANAKAKGIKLGAPSKISEADKLEVIKMCSIKKHDKKAIALQYGISVPLIYKILATVDT
jgi:DNA invertase Pin-like site-specific DNA recombinase